MFDYTPPVAVPQTKNLPAVNIPRMTSRIKIPTFDSVVVFMHDVDRSVLQKYAQKNHIEIDDLDEEFSGITVEMDFNVWLVYLPVTKNADLIWLVRTLSHEANHVILQLMKRLGIEDDETTCYAQDHLLGEMLEKVLKHGAREFEKDLKKKNAAKKSSIKKNRRN